MNSSGTLTWQDNDLASIKKRSGDGFERVGGTDEEYLAQVDRYVDVVILVEIFRRIDRPTSDTTHIEIAVLFRIQNFK